MTRLVSRGRPAVARSGSLVIAGDTRTTSTLRSRSSVRSASRESKMSFIGEGERAIGLLRDPDSPQVFANPHVRCFMHSAMTPGSCGPLALFLLFHRAWLRFPGDWINLGRARSDRERYSDGAKRA